MVNAKQIQVQDTPLTIMGPSNDPYFAHFNLADRTNDFLLHIAKSYLRPDAVILDVGANLGVTSAIFSVSAPRGQIFSFEPSPSIYPYLLKTIAANDIKNCVPFQLALGAQSGQLEFFDNSASASASHLVVKDVTLGGHTHKVEVSTLDQVVKENSISRLDLIKIDVEGLELDVLNGGRRTLESMKPAVFLEFNSFTLIAFGNLNPRFVLEQLLSIFPHVYRYEKGEVYEIRDPGSVLGFIHDNLIKRGCVDDLYCCFERL
jgi:FkbM family methyltransferase